MPRTNASVGLQADRIAGRRQWMPLLSELPPLPAMTRPHGRGRQRQAGILRQTGAVASRRRLPRNVHAVSQPDVWSQGAYQSLASEDPKHFALNLNRNSLPLAVGSNANCDTQCLRLVLQLRMRPSFPVCDGCDDLVLPSPS